MQRSPRWIPLLLAVLALVDLRGEVQLLRDHFTWSALVAAISAHPLAVAVLIFTPIQLRRSSR